MEDYVIIGSVLQAMHMSKFNKKAKHLKKYEINRRNDTEAMQNYTMCYQKLMSQSSDPQYRFSLKPNSTLALTSTMRNYQKNANMASEPGSQKKLKMKFILDQNEKINEAERKESNSNRQCISEYFTKSMIEPKLSRQHTSRTAALVKTPQAAYRYFYDTNIQCIRKKSRKCLIFPQKHKKDQIQATHAYHHTHANKQLNNVDIRQIIKQQWQQQKRRRKAHCKTTACRARHRNSMQKQTKRIEEQLRNKQNQQKYNKYAASQRNYTSHSNNYTNNLKVNFAQSFNMNKLTIPLTKNQMKSKASGIMGKYGIDSSRCYVKIISN